VTQQSDTLSIAYAPPTPGVNTKFKHDLHAFLFRAKPGLYAVFCEKETIIKIDPENKGKCMNDWSKTAEFSQWPNTERWREKDASGHLTAVPTIPGSCGAVNLVAVLKEQSAKEIEP